MMEFAKQCTGMIPAYRSPIEGSEVKHYCHSMAAPTHPSEGESATVYIHYAVQCHVTQYPPMYAN